MSDSGRQHPFDRLGLVLQVRAAERALVGHDLVFEQHHRAAAGTARLRRTARDGAHAPLGQLGRVLVEVALLNLGVDVLDLGLVPAIGALERTRARVELDLAPQFSQGKSFPLGGALVSEGSFSWRRSGGSRNGRWIVGHRGKSEIRNSKYEIRTKTASGLLSDFEFWISCLSGQRRGYIRKESREFRHCVRRDPVGHAAAARPATCA